MSLRGSSEKRTLCEVLREINDALQGTRLHPVLLPKLVEAEGMAKRMAKKLYEYNKNFDAGWWAANPDYKKDIERRLNENYLSG